MTMKKKRKAKSIASDTIIKSAIINKRNNEIKFILNEDHRMQEEYPRTPNNFR